MKEESSIDHLINIALDLEDYPWAKELCDLKYSLNNVATVSENMTTQYGILENGYIRKIKNLSDEEFFGSALVVIPITEAQKGEIVEYRILNMYERWYLLGYYKGRSSVGYGSYYF